MSMNVQNFSAWLTGRDRTTGKAAHTRLCAGLLLLLLSSPLPYAAQDKSAKPATQPQAATLSSPAEGGGGGAQRVVKEGIAGDFQIRPLDPAQAGARGPR